MLNLRRLFPFSAVMFAALAFAAILSPPGLAQPTAAIQAQTPLTRDIGNIRTLTATGASTVTSADQTGFNASRVSCVYNQTTSTGAPSTTFSIQNKDAASGNYYTLITSAAVVITNATVTSPIHVGAGVVATTNVSAGVPIARTWRVSVTVAGSSTPTVTGTVGCSVQ